ncbi:hypothetical protein AAG570_000707 [Ranatra chinensis]|uniref:Cysteine dioxygenase n=1 Tax=Ranatra chinensis TaxID=642074 RepID=A0ABD0YXW4_9HEMI
MEEVNKITTLEDLLAEISRIFDSDKVNVEHLHKTLAAYKSNPQQWKKYAKYDKYRYTRNLVDEGNGRYNVMILCWGGGQGSPIHDHANAHCFMKILQGSLQEVRFQWPVDNQPLRELSRTILPLDDVCYINDSLGLHRVENVSYGEPAASLHIYSPPFEECSVFNQQTGISSKAKVTFWSKYGNKPNRAIQDSRPPEDN